MKEQKRAMVKAAQLLEQQAVALREATLVWDGNCYKWPRSARAVERLHDEAERHATALRRMAT